MFESSAEAQDTFMPMYHKLYAEAQGCWFAEQLLKCTQTLESRQGIGVLSSPWDTDSVGNHEWKFFLVDWSNLLDGGQAQTL